MLEHLQKDNSHNRLALKPNQANLFRIWWLGAQCHKEGSQVKRSRTQSGGDSVPCTSALQQGTLIYWTARRCDKRTVSSPFEVVISKKSRESGLSPNFLVSYGTPCFQSKKSTIRYQDLACRKTRGTLRRRRRQNKATRCHCTQNKMPAASSSSYQQEVGTVGLDHFAQAGPGRVSCRRRFPVANDEKRFWLPLVSTKGPRVFHVWMVRRNSKWRKTTQPLPSIQALFHCLGLGLLYCSDEWWKKDFHVFPEKWSSKCYLEVYVASILVQ